MSRRGGPVWPPESLRYCWPEGRPHRVAPTSTPMFLRILSLYALVFCFAFPGDSTAFSDSDFDKARRLQEMGRYPEAERLYRAILAVEPDSVPALTNLGVVLSRQGNHSAAIAAYQHVLRLAPDLAEVKLNL